jgi:hypothetical protein
VEFTAHFVVSMSGLPRGFLPPFAAAAHRIRPDSDRRRIGHGFPAWRCVHHRTVPCTHTLRR